MNTRKDDISQVPQQNTCANLYYSVLLFFFSFLFDRICPHECVGLGMSVNFGMMSERWGKVNTNHPNKIISFFPPSFY